MTQYELTNNAYNMIWDSFSDERKNYITSKIGYQDYFYTSCVSWMSSFLNGRKWYSGEDECGNLIIKNYISAFQDIISMETGIILKRELCQTIIEYLRNNKED